MLRLWTESLVLMAILGLAGPLSQLVAAILIMGLIRRERYGLGRIGAESLAIMVVYALGVGLIFTG